MTRIPRLASVIGGRYELESLLAEGGMSQVWQGRHLALGMPVAVKLMFPRLIAKASSRERFLTEAKVMAALDTRHVVRVFDYGITPDEQPYLVMELVDGETLGQRLARDGRLKPELAVRLLTQAAKGLERAHARGIVHCDFKPDNVLLCRDEDGELLARVGDFGVAKLLSSSRWEARGESEEARPAEFAGTPVYMAPEQLVHGGEATPAADVWSFGVVAYELVTGKLPFEARDIYALGRRIARGEHTPPSSRRRDLPRSFDAWFLRACAIDPERRFPTIRAAAHELAIALGQEHAAGSGAPRSRRLAATRWGLAAGGAVAGALLVWGLGLRTQAPAPSVVATTPAVAPAEPPPRPAARATVAEPTSAAAPAATTAARRSVQRVALPTYRTLPEDEAPPARGFKQDPY